MPESLISDVIGSGGVLTIPLAVIVGVPMYASCAAIIPVAAALFGKGMPLGAVLAFAMATSALSIPEAVILRRAMRLKLIGIFFGIVALGIMIMGWMFSLA